MLVDYRPFIDRLIDKYEGDYGWNKADPGGPTKYGITCYDLADWLHLPMNSMTEWAPRVERMVRQTAEDIYAIKYASSLRFNDLNPGVDCCFLDYGINSGIARPVRVARALLGAGTGERFTDALVSQINQTDPAWFIDSMCKERLQFLKGLKTWGEFGHGWEARVDDLDRYCKGVVKAPRPELGGHTPLPTVPKGFHPAPDGLKHTVATGGAAAAAGAAVHTAALPAWAVGVVIAGAVAGGLAFALWQQHKVVAKNAAVVLPPTIAPHP